MDEHASAAELQAQSQAFAGYLERYLDQEKLKSRPPRTGWTRRSPDYKICLWGSSLGDWALFFLCFTILYGILILFYFLLLELYLLNVEDKTVMYIFFAIGIVAASALGLVIHWGNEEREMKRKAAEKADRQRARELEAKANAT